MKLRVPVLLLAFVLALSTALLAGCGGKPAETESTTTETPATPAPAASAVLAKSLYDDGPRAGESAVDAAAAAAGEKLYTSKGCPVCHKWGEKFTGPDLKGVSMRRTATWMEHQILDPMEMVKTDPIAHELFTVHKLQMTDQNLTPEEAKQVIEYLKKRDKDGK